MAGKPQKPCEDDCCESGCIPCVFDVYERQLRRWESESNSVANTASVLNTLKYVSFKLISIEVITSEANLYTFQAVDENLVSVKSRISLKMGDYLILRSRFEREGAKESISRPYTPVNNELLHTGSFQVYVKLYPNGKMSQNFKTASTGDIFLWRGPYNKFSYIKTDFLVLLGAGTGIVPLYNIAKELVLDEECETIISLFGCFKNLQSIYLRKHLHELTDYWNCSVSYFLTERNNDLTFLRENVTYCKLAGELFKNIVSKFINKNVLFVICGPDSFNQFCKGELNDFSTDCIIVL